MKPHHFDTITRAFATRRLSRRAAVAGTITAGAGLATGAMRSSAQEASPVASPTAAGSAATTTATTTATETTFLFVQSFAGGTLAPKAETTAATPVAGSGPVYTLTLTEGLGDTLFFSDRPERIVGTVPTPTFLDNLGFSPDNPPNAALIGGLGDDNEEIVALELFSPSYDAATRTATYDVRILQDYDRLEMTFTAAPSTAADHASTTYQSAHLFIDDCPNTTAACLIPGGDCPNTGTTLTVGQCWDWKEFSCNPCQDVPTLSAQCNDTYSTCNGQCTAEIGYTCN